VTVEEATDSESDPELTSTVGDFDGEKVVLQRILAITYWAVGARIIAHLYICRTRPPASESRSFGSVCLQRAIAGTPKQLDEAAQNLNVLLEYRDIESCVAVVRSIRDAGRVICLDEMT
jgi:hypothetical protein